ncbi:hypothetical protein [Streptomyces violascens]|uniref:hypothetical protein n=1 Tax=Streptomyces violascens TaxID=67381 RepID=UPI00368B3214
MKKYLAVLGLTTFFLTLTTGASVSAAAANPGPSQLRAERLCGSGYRVIETRDLDKRATVYLSYRSEGQRFCVTTIRATHRATDAEMEAFLEVQGRLQAHDRGLYRSYAGAVSLSAPNGCIVWGGEADGVRWSSPRSGACSTPRNEHHRLTAPASNSALAAPGAI